jgi:hypothetical protein
MSHMNRSRVSHEPKRAAAPCDRTDLLVRSRPLAPFLENPREAKARGLLPLEPPSRPRFDE